MTNEDQWLMRIEGALSAHCLQPEGCSRPGTDWSVGLKQGEREYHVMARTYFSDDMTKRAREDTEYQGHTVFGYLNDLLAGGWHPEQGGELVITIQNPDGELEREANKPWWKLW